MSLSLHLFSRLSTIVTRPNTLLAASSTAVASQRWMSGNELGRGAGKGGGTGGSIRDAGGSMGKTQAAKEEEYFRRLQLEQLGAMSQRLADEVAHHEQEIAHHLEAIKKHKANMSKLEGSGSESGHQHDKHCHHDKSKKH